MIHLMINIMIHRMIHIMIHIMIHRMIYLMTYIMTNIRTNIMINVMTAWKKVHSHSGQLSFFSPRTFDPTPVQRTRTHLEVRVLLPHGPTCGRPISAEPRGGTQVRDGIKHMCSLGILCSLSILCVLIMRPMRFFLDPALGLKHGLIFRIF